MAESCCNSSNGFPFVPTVRPEVVKCFKALSIIQRLFCFSFFQSCFARTPGSSDLSLHLSPRLLVSRRCALLVSTFCWLWWWIGILASDNNFFYAKLQIVAFPTLLAEGISISRRDVRWKSQTFQSSRRVDFFLSAPDLKLCDKSHIGSGREKIGKILNFKKTLGRKRANPVASAFFLL